MGELKLRVLSQTFRIFFLGGSGAREWGGTRGAGPGARGSILIENRGGGVFRGRRRGEGEAVGGLSVGRGGGGAKFFFFRAEIPTKSGTH